MRKTVYNLIWYILIISNLIFCYSIYTHVNTSSKIQKNKLLENTLKEAEVEFTNSLDIFSAHIAGIKSFLESEGDFPDVHKTKKYVIGKLQSSNYNDSLIVS